MNKNQERKTINGNDYLFLTRLDVVTALKVYRQCCYDGHEKWVL